MTFQIINFPFRNELIKLSAYNNSSKGHTFTIITGKNGVGKTQLLTSIVTEYLKDNLNMDVVSESQNPKKIIAISNIKYDNFPIMGKKTTVNYHYIGNKTSYNSISINDRYQVFKNLICNRNSNISNISEAFNYLGFTPKIRIVLRIFPPSNKSYQISNYTNLYEKYSNHLTKDIYAENINSFFRKVIDFKVKNYQQSINNFSDEFEKINTNNIKYNNVIKSNFKECLSKNDILLLDLIYKLDNMEIPIKKDIYYRLSEIVYTNKISLLKDIVFDFSEQYYFTYDDDLLFLLDYNLIRITDVYLSLNNGHSDVINFTKLSSGQQSLFNIFLGISGVIENNSLICIDEPEVNLHPEWQTEFILKLQNIFNHISGCHFIIATHSPQVVAGLKSENGYILNLEENILHNSIDYSKKSADYQLAKLFNAPGYNNEYIIKICLFLLSKIKEQIDFDNNDLLNIHELKDFQHLLKKDDPVYYLVKEVVSLSEV